MIWTMECKECEGSGHKGYYYRDPKDWIQKPCPCPHCKGSGGFNLGVEEKKLCYKCHGLGYNELEPCSCLNGWRYSYRPLTVDEVEELIKWYQNTEGEVDADMIVKWVNMGAPVGYKGQPVKLMPREG